MTSRLGLDYAWAHLDAQAHKSVGSTFACRYLSNDPAKNLSEQEARGLRQGGIDVLVVWESTADRALGGEAAGAQDARAAVAQANACGIPAGRPVYFAVDFDATAGQQAKISAYFKGASQVLGTHRVGVYGGYWPVKRLLDARLVGYAWQTYAWSGGNLDKRANLYQYSNGHTVAGVGVDFNRSLKPDFGQWAFSTPPLAPPHRRVVLSPWRRGFQAGFQDGFGAGWKARG